MKRTILKEYKKLLDDKDNNLHFLCHFLGRFNLREEFTSYLALEGIQQNDGNNVTSWFFDEMEVAGYDGLFHYSDCLRYLILEDFLNKLE